MKTTHRFTQRALRCALLALPIGLAAGCVDDDNPTSQLRTPTVARYAPSAGLIPIPNDILYAGSTDSTLNLPIANPADTSDPSIALSTLDGWSTLAPITIEFTRPIDRASVIGGSTVRFYEVTSAATTEQPVAGPVVTIDSELVVDTDYEIQFPASYGDRAVVLQPLVPLEASVAGVNGSSTYMVVVTNGVTDTDGVAVARDAEYAISAATALGTNPAPPESVIELNALVNQQLNVYDASSAMVSREDVVVSFTFTTQSVGAGLGTVWGIANGQESLIISNLCTFLGTCGGDTAPSALSEPLLNVVDEPESFLGTASELLGGGVGAARIFAGVFKAPYYLTQSDNSTFQGLSNDPTALAAPWRARYEFPGSTDRNVTRFNSLPIATTAQQIPLLVSIPTEVMGVLDRPANGWPVVIFMHGIGSNRTAMLPLAETLASVGVAMVAIDQPLHGVGFNDPLPDGTDIFVGYNNMLPAPDDVWERTFGLDLLTQDMDGNTLASLPDGTADASGAHFINLANLAVTRDNLRQAVSDLSNLKAALAMFDDIQGEDELDETNVHFIGHSLGGIVGTPFVALQSDLVAATLAMPGSGIPYLLDGSPFFGPSIRGALFASAGIDPSTPSYDQYLIAAQTLVDSADPANYGSILSGAATPIYLPLIVGGGAIVGETEPSLPDQVIPNAVDDAPFAGTNPMVASLGLSTIDMSVSGAPQRVSVEFTQGGHSSLLLPGTTPESAAALVEIQTQVAGFHASGGQSLTITDTSVIAPQM
ncbi:MAG: hypothetical protein AAFP86_09065 [Planctomycetota bacterium]